MRKIVLLLSLFACMATLSCNNDHYVVIQGYAQGGTYSVKFNTKGLKISTEEAARAVDSILTLIDTTLSGYNPGSILSRYNNGETVVPNALFNDIFEEAVKVFEYTDGTVDVAAAPLFDLWSFGFTDAEGKLPSADTLGKVLSTSGMANFSRNLERASNGQKLNYNAIAQGYSSDLIASYLKEAGVSDMLVDIGEIYCCGNGPSGHGWNIAVDTPTDGNNTPGADIQGTWNSTEDGSCGIVTSGNYRKFFVRDGKKYSHTLDPRTGRPTEHNLLSATIVAPTACEADAVATACMVMGLEGSKDFLAKRPKYKALLIFDDKGLMKTCAVNGFVLR